MDAKNTMLSSRIRSVQAQEDATRFAASCWLAKQVCAQVSTEAQLEEWMRLLRKGLSHKRKRKHVPCCCLAAIPEAE